MNAVTCQAANNDLHSVGGCQTVFKKYAIKCRRLLMRIDWDIYSPAHGIHMFSTNPRPAETNAFVT